MEHIFLIILLLAFYFLPAILAGVRSHHNTIAIALLTLFLGWTVIAWIVALVWAFTNNKEASIVINNTTGG